MIRWNPRRALVPCVVSLAALAACVVNLDFTFTESGQAVQAVETSNVLDSAISIDLSAQPDIQSHAGSIQSLAINSLDLTVTAVQSDNSVATVTGTLSVRPDGATDASQDVLVGALDAFPIQVNSGVHLLGSPALDAFALATAKGSLRFKAIIHGTTTGGQTADFAVDLKLSMSMGYDAGL